MARRSGYALADTDADAGHPVSEAAFANLAGSRAYARTLDRAERCRERLRAHLQAELFAAVLDLEDLLLELGQAVAEEHFNLGVEMGRRAVDGRQHRIRTC